MLEAIVLAIPALLKLILMIVEAIKSTPAEKRVDFVNELGNAMKKVKDEKNPADLAKLISNL